MRFGSLPKGIVQKSDEQHVAIGPVNPQLNQSAHRRKDLDDE